MLKIGEVWSLVERAFKATERAFRIFERFLNARSKIERELIARWTRVQSYWTRVQYLWTLIERYCNWRNTKHQLHQFVAHQNGTVSCGMPPHTIESSRWQRNELLRPKSSAQDKTLEDVQRGWGGARRGVVECECKQVQSDYCRRQNRFQNSVHLMSFILSNVVFILQKFLQTRGNNKKG